MNFNENVGVPAFQVLVSDCFCAKSGRLNIKVLVEVGIFF
jgi:hypothetical protein